jgi:hypothetical protein
MARSEEAAGCIVARKCERSGPRLILFLKGDDRPLGIDPLAAIP